MSGIVPLDSAQGGGGFGDFLSGLGKGSTALALLIVGIILLVVGMYLVSQENTSSGYPVLITGVLAGGLGGYLMYSATQKKREEGKAKKEEGLGLGGPVTGPGAVPESPEL